MSEKSHAFLTLGLAVASLSVPSSLLANSTQNQEPAWTCTMNKAQEWTCDVSDEPVQPQAPAKDSEETLISESSDAPIKVEPTGLSVAPAAPEKVDDTTEIETVETVKAETESIDRIQRPKIVTAADKSSKAARPAQPQITRAAVANAKPEWQCEADAKGNWLCDQQTPTIAVRNIANTAQQAAIYTENPYSHLDWVASSGQGFCAGYYQAPEFIDNRPLDDSIYLEAGQTSTQLGGLTQLEKGVNLQHENRLLNANYAELDQDKNHATLEGNVSFREPGLLIRGSKAQTNLNSKETQIHDALFVMHEQSMRGGANRFVRLQDERLKLEEGYFTYCPPGDTSWQVNADTLTINKEEGFGTAKHASLEVAGVPILYVPYFSFPIDDRRRSGFLYPSISISSNNGLELGVPYYFNLAANYDDTVTPRLFTERGLQIENEFRYLNDWSLNRLSTAYLPNDREYNDDRWLLGLEHNSQNSGRWQSKVDFTRVSDKDYYDDLDTMLDVSKEDHLQQTAEVRYNGDGYMALARVQSYQTISDDKSPYRRLPQIIAQGSQAWGNTAFSMITEYVNFDRDLSGLTGADRIIGERVHLRPALSYNYQRPWGYVRPSAQLWHTSYQLENQLTDQDDNPSISVPVVGLDSGLYFDRQMKNGGQQTLEPRLFMLYAKDEDQSDIPVFDTAKLDFNYRSLFRYNRFSGHDRIGDSQQISLGLTSRWLQADGYEQARFSIGQAYYFDDQNVFVDNSAANTEGQSDIATELVWNFSRKWRGTADLIFDEKFDTSKSNFKLNYKADLNHRLNLSYRFEENERKQVDSSIIWPLAPQWGIIGRWQYDIENNENVEALFGIEYDDCCWSVRVVAREWLDDTDNTDSALYVQFFLKGLGSLGSGDGNYLDNIIGFKEREEYKHD